MLKPPVSKFRPDLSARLIDITEKQIPTKPKPIEALSHVTPLRHGGVIPPALRAARRLVGNVCSGTLGSSVTAKRSPRYSYQHISEVCMAETGCQIYCFMPHMICLILSTY